MLTVSSNGFSKSHLVLGGLEPALAPAAGAAEIAKGDPARAEILDGIQSFVEWATGQPVILSGARIRIVGAWAHLRARVLRLDGNPVAPDAVRVFGRPRAPVTTSAILRARGGRWLKVYGEDDQDSEARRRALGGAGRALAGSAEVIVNVGDAPTSR